MADGTEKPMPFNGDMAMITPPSSPEAPAQGRADPFNCPVPWQAWFDKVLHHSKSSLGLMVKVRCRLPTNCSKLYLNIAVT